MIGLTVDDGGALKRLQQRLADESNGAVRRETVGAMKDAAPGLESAARDAARSTLPKRGGLADLVASAQFTTRTPGRDTVQMVATGDAVASTDSGRVNHPVYGGKGRASQAVPGGWFTGTMRRQAPPAVLAAVLGAARRISYRIVKG